MGIAIAVPQRFSKTVEDFLGYHAVELARFETLFKQRQYPDSALLEFVFRDCALIEFLTVEHPSPTIYALHEPHLCTLSYVVQLQLLELRQLNFGAVRAYQENAARAALKFKRFDERYPVHPQ